MCNLNRLQSKGPAMPNFYQTSVRIPESLVERADELIPRLAAEERMMFLGHVSRSDVLRVAILRGIELLEEELPEAPQNEEDDAGEP